MDLAQKQKIWRWLDAVHDCEPPQEQPAFEYSDTHPTGIPNEDHKAKVFRRYQHQILVNQAEKARLSMETKQLSSLAQQPTQTYGQVQIPKRSPISGSNGGSSKDDRTPFTAVSGDYFKAPLASLNRDIETTGHSTRDRTFVERTKNLDGAGALDPPSKTKFEINDTVGISRAGSVSKWVGRIRANSRCATTKLFKRTE